MLVVRLRLVMLIVCRRETEKRSERPRWEKRRCVLTFCRIGTHRKVRKQIQEIIKETLAKFQLIIILYLPIIHPY